MKTSSSLILLGTAALSTAQITKNANGTYTCALAQGSYCLTTSLTSSTIIRCENHIGVASNCDTRLADKSPLGESYSPCWQTSTISGNALCTKNGIVYPDGNNTTPYPVPNYQYISASISSVATADVTAAAMETSWPYTNLSTSTTTTTRTNFVYSTSTLYLSGSSPTSGVFSNSTGPFANGTSSPYNAANALAQASPVSTTYTTSVVYIYTTVCPAGLTITDSYGSKSIVATPTTLTLTTTKVQTTQFPVKTANIGVAPARPMLEGSGEPIWGWVNATSMVGPTATGVVAITGTGVYAAPSILPPVNISGSAVAPIAIVPAPVSSDVAPSAVIPSAVAPSVTAPYPIINAAGTTLSIIGTAAPSPSASAGWIYNSNGTNITPFTGAAADTLRSRSSLGVVAAVVGIVGFWLL